MSVFELTDFQSNQGGFGKFPTLEEAVDWCKENEKEDRQEGNYEPDWYEILEKNDEGEVINRYWGDGTKI